MKKLRLSESMGLSVALILVICACSGFVNNGVDPTARRVGNSTIGSVSSLQTLNTNKNAATLDPTGFENQNTIVSVYDGTAKTITLTQVGGVVLWFKGVRTNLGTPWVSPPHGDTGTHQYLSFPITGSVASASWSESPWSFADAQVAAVYNNGYKFCHAEHHGMALPWEAHKAEHYSVGTRVIAGLGLTPGTYAVASTTISDANNTPGFNAGSVADEDLETSIASWTEGTYSKLSLIGTGTVIINTTSTGIASVTGTYPNYYVYSAGNFTRTEMGNSNYANYYQVVLPVSSSVGCQVYRTLILQPQFQYSSLAAAQAEDFRQLALGELTMVSPEFVAYTRMTIRTSSSYNGATGRFRIEAVSYLTGSKATQVSISALTVPNTADSILTTTTNFNKNLGVADTTVQKALETLDDLTTGGDFAPLNGSQAQDFTAKRFTQTFGSSSSVVLDSGDLFLGFVAKPNYSQGLLQDLGSGTYTAIATFTGQTFFRRLLNIDNGLVFGATDGDGLIHRSRNYGKTWEQVYSSGETTIYSLAYLGNDVLLAGANSGKVFKSTDLGTTWAYTGYSSGVYMYKLAYLGNGVVIGLDNGGKICRSMNYGANWSTATVTTGIGSLRDSTVLPDGTILVCGGNPSPKIVKSVNNGLTWSSTSFTAVSGTYLNALVTLPTGVVIAGGYRNIYRSVDGGNSWITVATTTEEITVGEYLGGHSSFFLGSTGLYKSSDMGLTWSTWPITGLTSAITFATNVTDSLLISNYGSPWGQLYLNLPKYTAQSVNQLLYAPINGSTTLPITASSFIASDSSAGIVYSVELATQTLVFKNGILTSVVNK